MHPISPNRVATSIVLAVGLVCWISCAMAQGTNDLPEKLATVNGKPIYQKDIVPDDTGIVRQLRVAVDHELIAQRAAKEGIDLPDRGPSRQALLGRLTQKETMWLGVMYEEKIWAGRTFDTPQNKAEAYGEWLRTLLANVHVTNRDAIPAALIEQATETVLATLRHDPVEAGGGAALYDKISGLVIAREAKERGVEPAVVAADAEQVKLLLAAAEMTVDRQKLLLGNLPAWAYISRTADSGRAPDSQLLTVVKEQVLAVEARQKGFDKDPAFMQQTTQLVADKKTIAARSIGVAPALISTYYKNHNLTADDVEVTASELEGYYVAVFQTVMGADADAKDAVRRHLNSAKQKIAAADLTDDEWKSWQLHIALSFLNENRTTMRDRIAAAKLEWTRQAHIKELRAHADIEFLVDLD